MVSMVSGSRGIPYMESCLNMVSSPPVVAVAVVAMSSKTIWRGTCWNTSSPENRKIEKIIDLQISHTSLNMYVIDILTFNLPVLFEQLRDVILICFGSFSCLFSGTLIRIYQKNLRDWSQQEGYQSHQRSWEVAVERQYCPRVLYHQMQRAEGHRDNDRS